MIVRRMFGVLLVALVLILGVSQNESLAWRIGLTDFTAMSSAECAAVVCGEEEPEEPDGSLTDPYLQDFHDPGMCYQPESPGGQCNKLDTQCSRGNNYCEEHEYGDKCADKFDYQGPNECVAATSTEIYCYGNENKTSHCITIDPCKCNGSNQCIKKNLSSKSKYIQKCEHDSES